MHVSLRGARGPDEQDVRPILGSSVAPLRFGRRFAKCRGMRAPVAIFNHSNLKQRRAALEKKLGELTGVFQDVSELTVETSPDVLDTIQMTTDRDVCVERMNISAQILSDVRAALESLDNGGYGTCEDCDEPISPRRLDAVPWARVCVKCQEARESRRTGDERGSFDLAA
jgi:DnaK suppressor protein